MGLLRKGKTRIIAKFHCTHLCVVIISTSSRERKTPSYSQGNTALQFMHFPLETSLESSECITSTLESSLFFKGRKDVNKSNISKLLDCFVFIKKKNIIQHSFI